MSSGLNCPIASESSSSMSSTVQEIAQEEFPGQYISSWSDLPQELLLAIAQRVETLFDIIQFRAVCKTWRQSASFSSLPKRNLLSPILPYKISTLSHFFLSEAEEIPGESMIIVESSVFLLRSTLNPELPPWLFTVEELNPGKVYLRKPLSQLAIEKLPENFPKMLQLSQFQVLKIGSLYTLRFEDDHKDMFGMGWCTFNSKVVLLVNSDHITTPAIHDYFVIVLYGDGDLAAMRLGNEEHSHLRSISGTRKFDDIVNFKGQIYAIDRRGRAYRMHNGQFVLESIVNDPIGKGSGADRRKRLAESCGDLYLVYRRRDCGFRIFKLNEEQKFWVEIEGIGYDKILFVTFDGCIFASAKDFPGWKGNCIVFYRGCFPSYTGSAFFDYDIFKTRKRELDIAVFHLGGGDCGSITSYPTYSNVLWPPPTWLSSNKCSSGCVPEDQITSEPISKTRISTTLQVSQDTPNVHEGDASRG